MGTLVYMLGVNYVSTSQIQSNNALMDIGYGR